MKDKVREVVEKMLDNALDELKKGNIPSKETLEMIRIALSYAFDSNIKSASDAFIIACEDIKNDIKVDDERKWYCTAHWLNSFYQDFILERKAGEYMPCGTCDYVETCKDCPLINFQIMNEKTDHPISPRRIKNNEQSPLEKRLLVEFRGSENLETITDKIMEVIKSKIF